RGDRSGELLEHLRLGSVECWRFNARVEDAAQEIAAGKQRYAHARSNPVTQQRLAVVEWKLARDIGAEQYRAGFANALGKASVERKSRHFVRGVRGKFQHGWRRRRGSRLTSNEHRRRTDQAVARGGQHHGSIHPNRRPNRRRDRLEHADQVQIRVRRLNDFEQQPVAAVRVVRVVPSLQAAPCVNHASEPTLHLAPRGHHVPSPESGKSRWVVTRRPPPSANAQQCSKLVIGTVLDWECRSRGTGTMRKSTFNDVPVWLSIATLALIWALRDVVTLIAYAVLLAYALLPAVQVLQRVRLSPQKAVSRKFAAAAIML